MTTCFLRFDADSLEQSEKFLTIHAAKMEYLDSATELARFGQVIGATIHIGNSMDEIVEYPDYVLSLGPKGGLVCQRA
jgi:hypothetical protein